uniref:ABC-2 type transporter domain-containing protein n=1 Tax=Rhodosorus marinus TaxID=101924 RepID=A0A7S0BHM4_9RHOD
MAFILALTAGSINYWLVGYNSEFGRYCFFIFNLFLSLTVAEGMMTLIASIIPILILAFAVAACLYGAFMVVMGFFIRLDNIGWWWRWMHYISLHSYSFSSFMINEFSGTEWPACPPVDGQPGTPAISGDQVLERYDYDQFNMWVNCGILVGMVIFYRGATTLWQWKFHDARK